MKDINTMKATVLKLPCLTFRNITAKPLSSNTAAMP